MSLGIKLVQALQKQAAMKRPFPMHAEASDALRAHGRKGRKVTAAVTLSDNDRLSHLVEVAKVRLEGAAQNPETVARRFAERATYLSEALRFVECAGDGAAILRSTPETMRARREPYFEARVGEGEIALRRYQAHPDRPGRAALPFCVTDEVLTRLVDDAAAALNPKADR